jgi:hypothetical protein
MKTEENSRTEIIADLYRRALRCRVCFAKETGLKAPIIDVAQPRWVGARYWDARPRIAFVMLNPGAGDASKDIGNRDAQKFLLGFRDGDATFADVLAFQWQHMKTWGRPAGRFLRFYISDLNLKLDDVAFLNIALCATLGNRYPCWMLDRCFDDHSSKILQRLNPDLVVLCGVNVRRFASVISASCKSAKVVTMFHHAHRRGRDMETSKQALLRTVINSLAETTI